MATKYFFMRAYIITTLLCVCLVGFALIVGPATAMPTLDVKESILEKISGTPVVWYDYSAAVGAIRDNSEKNPTEKLSEMSVVFGADEKLIQFVSKQTDNDLKDGEGNIITDIIKNIGELLGGKEPATPPVDEYTDAEGNQAWSQYLANYILNYQPTGDFGAPIK